MESVKIFTAIKGVSDMTKYPYQVLLENAWDCSGDEPLGQTPSKLKIVAVEGGE